MSEVLTARLEQLCAMGVPDAVCQRLGELIREAPAAQLAKLSPPRLARIWGVDHAVVLETFLQATRSGLLELEWDVRCPSCTGPTQREAHLALLRARSQCDFCRVEFDGSFDSSIEVTWRVHPDLRDLSQVEPLQVLAHHFQPLPVASLRADPDATVSTEVALQPGNYHFYVHARGLQTGMRVSEQGGADGDLELRCGDQLLERGPWERTAGTRQLRFHNSGAAPVGLALLRVADLPWVSAAELAANQSFRDLFSAELIQPGENFAIRNATFVFTDLKGSTALYERVGDARAFAMVRDHFELMTDLVRHHGGAIVKTIGDAIMATFLSPAAGLRFALDMLEAFDRFNAAGAGRDEVVVKVGLHAGPCIAVTLNERLDYFGRTVNLAARVQGQSEGRDVVLCEELAGDPRVQDLLGTPRWQRQSFSAVLKGIEEERALLRLQPTR